MLSEPQIRVRVGLVVFVVGCLFCFSWLNVTEQADAAMPKAKARAKTKTETKGKAEVKLFEGRVQQMAVTANKRATQAAIQALKKGGSAIDAAVAAAFVLGVVEPYSSGMGGGGFLVYYDAKKKQVRTLDFRERAPQKATSDMFTKLGRKGRKLSQYGHLAVGVPGFVSGLHEAHRLYGTSPWAGLLEPARRYAKDGFRVYRLLDYVLRVTRKKMRRFKSTKKVFYPKGKRLRKGQWLKQPDMAKTIGRLQKFGAGDFYKGQIAKLIVAEIQRGKGILTLADMKRYKPYWKAPLRGKFRGHTIYSMGSPSSGGVHMLQILNILSGFSMAKMAPFSGDYMHLQAEAMRLAFADRAKFQGDTRFAYVPVRGLLSTRYAASLRKKISPKRAARYRSVVAGNPTAFEKQHTSHLSIIDRWGNAVAMTLTINRWFGCGVVADKTGIVLNNEMDDFTTHPGKPNLYGLIQSKANAIGPDKTPLSAMTPTLVFHNGTLRGALGSAGGPKIITTITQLLLHLIEHNMSAKKAMLVPRIHHQWRPHKLFLERKKFPNAAYRRLRKLGHRIRRIKRWGNAQLLWVDQKGRLTGAADPRAAGFAQGF